jgi:hypothetical protein
LATLGVSESFVHNALRNQQGGVYLGTDKRGKHEPHNKTTKYAMEVVRKHIESYVLVFFSVVFAIIKFFFLSLLSRDQNAWNISFRFLSFIFIVHLKVHLEQSTGFNEQTIYFSTFK